ncbi:ribosome biogenesis GTP-binding protein YihA/YsxC [Desulfolucanica intricata]|uniref:ribosome biogenesis GTP-binding protein YihA/YsxC n=1 Tax=Desulfolucanica intricata TaxID=1285191 RepID=UPI0008297049|nr:ribosome biogenesis GTP-binding protein YihA/YsxC [Desulfolucanica intricata]
MKITSAEFVTSAPGIKHCPEGGKYPEVGFVGRSNVGKSSLINKLVNRKNLARTSKTPGRTQLLNYFLINNTFYIVDFPGYGFARVPENIRASWGKMIEEYLKNRKELRGVVLLVDIRHKPTAQDVQMFEWLQHYNIPTAIVATKADKLSRNQQLKQEKIIKAALGLENENILLFSSQTGKGKDELLDLLSELIET